MWAVPSSLCSFGDQHTPFAHSTHSSEISLYFLPLILTLARAGSAIGHFAMPLCTLFHTIYGCAEQSSFPWGSRLSPCSVKRDQSLLPRLHALNWLLIQGLSTAVRLPQRVSERAFSKSLLADPGLLQAALPLNTDQVCHTILHSLPSPLQLDTIHLLQAAQSCTCSSGMTPMATPCSSCCSLFTSSRFPGLSAT